MQKIKVKYVPGGYKGVFMYTDFARKVLRLVKWKKL